MERVSLVEPNNDSNAIIIAPHGADDDFTEILTRQIAFEADCYAVINNCWERNDVVDVFNDKANCNNISHILTDVPYDEFLLPILRFHARILKTFPACDIFIMHGMSNNIRKKAGTSEIDMVLGTGLGKPKSSSLSENRRNLLINCLQKSKFKVFEGKEGGDYSGWSHNNLNQYFRKHSPDSRTHSVQIEVIKELREDEDTARITGSYLGESIKWHLEDIKSKGYVLSNNNIPYVKVPSV